MGRGKKKPREELVRRKAGRIGTGLVLPWGIEEAARMRVKAEGIYTVTGLKIC